jgi:hypothetical protein
MTTLTPSRISQPIQKWLRRTRPSNDRNSFCQSKPATVVSVEADRPPATPTVVGAGQDQDLCRLFALGHEVDADAGGGHGRRLKAG